MKNLSEVYTQVLQDEALQAKLSAVKTTEELQDFVKKLGCEATVEEITSFLEANQANQAKEGELNDEELLQVAGGKSATKGETFLSCISLGIGCAVRVLKSASEGEFGTKIKDKGVLCDDPTLDKRLGFD